ncbi:MAG: carbamoyl-phosphate synthase large subunit, partial [Planctomycetota bacterium]
MPKDNSIKKVLIIGSGPIIIGQACEFDYSGTQGAKALKEEGIKVVLVNSNPATIMTDPAFADATYIEPLFDDILEKIIENEKPDSILPTLGGQTALNIATRLYERGVLQRFGVRLLGANYEAIKRAEDRAEFKKIMLENGLPVPKSAYVQSVEQALECIEYIGFPCVIRPSYTLGGTGGGIAYNMEEFKSMVKKGIELSLVRKVLIEESLYGWKEFELEVMRDKRDNCIIICSIENFDPMGVHTGDSITVAPIQTLTDKEYQQMREMAIKVIRAIGVETGGANIQFAQNPKTGQIYVIEINPRVSRSSALASKATGFPIAKIAAKLAIGYTLDEIPNDITKKTPSSYEPALDYCVVKIPKWAFEKFPELDNTLTTQMKSVGEVMAIGRNFKDALQKAIRALEENYDGIVLHNKEKYLISYDTSPAQIIAKLNIPTPMRLFYIPYALKKGFSVSYISEITKIDKWFIGQISEIVELEQTLKEIGNIKKIPRELFLKAKMWGFSNNQIATATGSTKSEIENYSKKIGLHANFNAVDTCAGEFEAYTPYYYLTYTKNDDLPATIPDAVIILGSGPNRIGQGIEFDYCCVHSVFALKKMGYKAIMINSNPETVSTDYDTSDILFFEPVHIEHIYEICKKVKPIGVISQFGGQTPLKLSLPLFEWLKT